MRIFCFVPIKLTSQRLPKKMLLPLGDKILFQHIFDTLIDVKNHYELTEHEVEVYCFCSDETLKDDLPEGVIFLKRDSTLDSDETLGIDIYTSFIERVPGDIYVLCHATSPFIKSSSIIKGVDGVISDEYDSAASVSRIQTFCWYQGKTLNYELTNVVRTQNIEPVFYETSAFYIFEKDILKAHRRRIGNKPLLIETDRVESIDIDEKEDYDLAYKIMMSC